MGGTRHMFKCLTWMAHTGGVYLVSGSITKGILQFPPFLATVNTESYYLAMGAFRFKQIKRVCL